MSFRIRGSSPAKAAQQPSAIEQGVEIALALANEPSVGLCYIQQHVQQSTPHVIALENQLTELSSEVLCSFEQTGEVTAIVKGMKLEGPSACDRIIASMDACLPHLPALARAKASRAKAAAEAAAALASPQKGFLSAASSALLGQRAQTPSRSATTLASDPQNTPEGKAAAPEAGGSEPVPEAGKTTNGATEQSRQEEGPAASKEAGDSEAEGAAALSGLGGGLSPLGLLQRQKNARKSQRHEAEYESIQKAQMERLKKWLDDDEY